MKLGVIGIGIVGNAFYEGMKHAFDVVRYDRFRPDSSDVSSIQELVTATDGPIFICVPTPMNPDGSASIKIVEDVVREISIFAGPARIVVIKSTVPPGTTQYLNDAYGGHISIAFNPEFLTEANPVEDFKNQGYIIVGGKPETTQTVMEVYMVAYPSVLKVQCNSTSAEMVKYIENCFLATKVSFANEMYQICEKLGINYDNVLNIAMLDKRLGRSHWKVPGPDGHKGFGLTCFPKDINALISAAKKLGVTPTMLEAAWNKNLEVRPERDWEQMKGRAVV